ncbi:MAG: methyltransferase domain-containing protein [Elusimicrobia bacterium]|nr:methyltransferase domain-containing protein [Elusimicrobiota bacterium]
MGKLKKFFSGIPYLKKIYNTIYNPATGNTIRFIAEKPVILNFLDKNLGKVLENGCGEGSLFTRYLADNSEHVTASDVLEERIEQAKKITYGRENISFTVADAQKLPFDDACFDTVVCTQVLEHIKNDRLAVSEIGRVLKENGRLILSVPVPPEPFDDSDLNPESADTHKREGYTYKQIRELLYDNSLEVLEYRYSFLIFSRFAFKLINWFNRKFSISPPAVIIALLTRLDKLVPQNEEFNPYVLVLKARKRDNLKKYPLRSVIAEKWEHVFDKLSDPYSPVGVTKRLFLRVQKTKPVKTILNYCKSDRDKKIIEAGSGSARIIVTLATMGFDATALDVSEQMLENASKLASEAEKYFGKLQFHTTKQDLEKLDIPDESYDVVLSDGVIEHWLDDNERLQVISEMIRIMKKGGTMLILVPNGRHPFYWWWVLTRYSGYWASPPTCRYGFEKLKKELESAGLKNVEVEGSNPYESISLWPRNFMLTHIGGILRRILPLPKWVKNRFGVTLTAVGRKI